MYKHAPGKGLEGGILDDILGGVPEYRCCQKGIVQFVTCGHPLTQLTCDARSCTDLYYFYICPDWCIHRPANSLRPLGICHRPKSSGVASLGGIDNLLLICQSLRLAAKPISPSHPPVYGILGGNPTQLLCPQTFPPHFPPTPIYYKEETPPGATSHPGSYY